MHAGVIQPVTVMGLVQSHRVNHFKKASLYSEIATPILGIITGNLFLAQELFDFFDLLK